MNNIAAATPGVPYLNLQYFYCLISGLFGAPCGAPAPSAPLDPVATSAPAVPADGGFWSWLWPFGGSTGSAGTVAEPGLLMTVIGWIGTAAWFIWTVFSWASYTLSFALGLVVVGALIGIAYIRFDEWRRYDTLPPATKTEGKGRARWQDLLNEAMSPEPRRWREAIIAADAMLGMLLTRLGYPGETTGDRLRSVPEDAFVTVPVAWEAHRIKNFVVARNSNFVLTQREAFRVMKLYEQVFEEFDVI